MGSEMTDLEITKLCAFAMGHMVRLSALHGFAPSIPIDIGLGDYYDPLHDDAQAMALVKEFHIWIEGRYTYIDMKVFPWKVEINDGEDQAWQAENSDLNRAICECVAKMQAAK
jgi:hypothetical protein